MNYSHYIATTYVYIYIYIYIYIYTLLNSVHTITNCQSVYFLIYRKHSIYLTTQSS